MAEATVRLGMDTRPFEQGAQKATTTIEGISTFAAAKFALIQSVVSKAVDAGASLMQAGLQKLQGEFTAAVKASEGMQATGKHLEEIYKNAGDAEKAMKGLGAVSSVMDLSRANAQAMGEKLAEAGVKAGELALAVGVLANIGAGQGLNPQGLADIYARTFKAGKVELADFNALVQSGVPIQEQLARSMFVSFGQIPALVEKGKISADEFAKALQKMGTSNGNGDRDGQYSKSAGAAVAALETFDAKFRKIRETIQEIAVDVLNIFNPPKKGDQTGPLDAIKKALEPLAAKILEAFAAVRPTIQGIASDIKSAVDALSEGPGIADKIADGIKKGGGALSIFKDLPATAKAFADELRDGIGFLTNALKQGTLFEMAGLTLEIAFNKATDGLKTTAASALLSALDAFSGGFESAKEAFRSALGYATDALTDPELFGQIANSIASAFSSVETMLKDAFNSAAEQLKPALLYAMQEAANALQAGGGLLGKILGAGAAGGKTLGNFREEAGIKEGPKRDWGAELVAKLREEAPKIGQAIADKIQAGGEAVSKAGAAGKAALQGATVGEYGPSMEEFRLGKLQQRAREGMATRQNFTDGGEYVGTKLSGKKQGIVGGFEAMDIKQRAAMEGSPTEKEHLEVAKRTEAAINRLQLKTVTVNAPAQATEQLSN